MATAKPDDDKAADKAAKTADKAREQLASGEITWRQYLAALGQADPTD